jgi:NAD(P)-dependent dehydrogenase (short-subunit alcohol dehydrogenase family)
VAVATVALVTGASSGIGAATARLLSERGFEVYGTSRRPDDLPPSAPPSIRWVAMDVCSDDSVSRGVREVLEKSSRIDALVCNAGSGTFGSVEEMPLDVARAQLETNFFGTLRTLRAVLPGLRERRGGRVVLVGSLAGRAPIPFQAHYSASKAAIDALALALRNELHPFGVRISLVEPGDIRTAFNAATDFGDTSGSAYGERIENCRRAVEEFMPRAPAPEIVAEVIHRALTARRPRVRYTVGPESRLVPLGRRLLPDALMLRFIRSHFRI